MCKIKTSLLCIVLMQVFCLTFSEPIWLQENYIYVEKTNSFYQFHEERKTWQEAVAICSSEGSWLFYAEDQDELNQVKQLVSTAKNIWIGISDLQVAGNFETIDGRSINDVYNGWFRNEPYRHIDLSIRCAVMRLTRSKMWIRICDDPLSFVCKYSREKPDNVSGLTTTPIPTEISKTTADAVESNQQICSGDKCWTSEEMHAADAYSYSHLDFGNLVREELRKFSPKERLEVWISILQVIKDNWSKLQDGVSGLVTSKSQAVISETTTETGGSNQQICIGGSCWTSGEVETTSGDSNSYIYFGNVVGFELKKFPHKEKLQVMVSILHVLDEHWSKLQNSFSENAQQPSANTQ